MYFNQVNYRSEIYNEQVLDKYIINKNFPVKKTDNKNLGYSFQKTFLESEERYLGDGFFPR